MRMSFLILSLFLCCSCQPHTLDQQALIDDFYAAKCQELFAEKRGECKENIREVAKAHLDSIVHQLLKADAMDTLVFPPKPVRPVAPEHIIGTVKKF